MSLTSSHFFSYILYRWILKYDLVRNALTRLLVRDVTETVELFSRPLCVSRRREIGYWRAVRHQQSNVVFYHEIPALLSVMAVLRSNTTFIDCGANVGLFSAAVAPLTRIHPELHLYAFEPNPDTFARLAKTLEGYRVELFNIALSDRSGSLGFTEGVTSGVYTPRDTEWRGAPLYHVQCRRLDEIGITGVNLVLKVDVEGHEWEVLAGAEGLFRQNRIDAVFIDGTSREPKIVEMLRAYRFTLWDARSLQPYSNRHGRILALRSK